MGLLNTISARVEGRDPRGRRRRSCLRGTDSAAGGGTAPKRGDRCRPVQNGMLDLYTCLDRRTRKIALATCRDCSHATDQRAEYQAIDRKQVPTS
jgi:hypothetical protein